MSKIGHFSPSISIHAKQLWDDWNIRGAILFSLFLQIVLIFVAPIRSCTRRKAVVTLIWFAYLLADWAANYTVGLISNSQRNQPNSYSSNHSISGHTFPYYTNSLANQTNSTQHASYSKTTDSHLLAFWAPFLLLHLGGPDTITAFSLEDNQLWLRHLLGLVTQLVAVAYVFSQSLPNRLWFLTVLMIIGGFIKYAERTLALYLASLDKFRDSMLKKPDPGPNYAKIMEEYDSKRKAELPTQITMTREPDKEAKASDSPPKEGALNDLEVVHYAYKYFGLFKGLIVDLIFSFRERDESRDFFNLRSPEDALRIIEVELNFIYGALYTKVEVVHFKYKLGYIFRFIAFGLVLATLGIFYFQTKKDDFHGVDKGITYTLLIGAIALDVISFLVIIFSDRTFASIKDPDRPRCWPVAAVFSGFLYLRRPWWHPCRCSINLSAPANGKIFVEHNVLVTPLAFRRWSASVSAHNLVRFCLRSSCKTIHEFPSLCEIIGSKIVSFETIDKIKQFIVFQWIASFRGYIKEKMTRGVFFRKVNSFFRTITFPIEDLRNEFMYVSREPFTMELWEFIFKELKNKSEFADTPETAKRISSARGDWVLTDTDSQRDRSKLLKYVSDDFPYDQSLLLWHIATDLCYYHDEKKGTEANLSHQVNEELSDQVKEKHSANLSHRQFSKILSDYMLYLLVFRPTMMSAVAGIGKIRYRDTCEEAKRFFDRRSLEPNDDSNACEAILSVNTDVGPTQVKGDRSKSVLFDASMLAKELNRMEEEEGEDKWKLMSRVWVELVSYAASHCRASTHAEEVSKGGELISFFWLLMTHFGLGEQFQINEGHARAKLLVGK